MCGIAGVLDVAGGSVDRGMLNRMIGSIRHRGPDAEGIHIEERVGIGLAHARLSIIDLTSGQQPMCNEDRSLWISFNGEIFNYIELRAELQRMGRRFITESDTEVILQMYAEYGDDCVRHFNGDWAFALWDGQRRRLLLSRDRVGVRPLFYARAGDQLVFASEVKALLQHPLIDRAIDLEALEQVFTFWCPLAPRTVFKGVSELPSGHNLVVEKGNLRIWPYWQIDFPDADSTLAITAMSEDDAAAQLLDLLTDATRIRLRSDVPVGAYLSGGLDSSLITALIERSSGARLRSFSVTFGDPEFDESGFQNEVVRHLDTEHQAIRCSDEDLGRVFPDVVWHTEKPILRTAPAPLFLLSQLVRDQQYKVVLTGEGADEFLGGYDIFKEAKIRRFWATNINSRWRPILLKRLYPYLPNLQSQSNEYRKSFFHVDAADIDNPFFSHLPRWELTARTNLFFSRDVKQHLDDNDVYRDASAMLPRAFGCWSDLAQAQFLEASILLPGYILSSQGDRMAMAHSVEGRFPFLDHRVIEFASRLPPRLKIKVLNEKFLLKHAVRGLLPSSVLSRPKQPYRAPDAPSFFDSTTRRARHDYVDEMLSPGNLRKTGLFSELAVGKLADKARRGQIIGAKDNMALVGILSTQLLVDQFISRQGRLS